MIGALAAKRPLSQAEAIRLATEKSVRARNLYTEQTVAVLTAILAAEEAKAAGQALQIINVSGHKPRRMPSAKWRELIKKVWEADPLLCPKCQKEMRSVSLIDDRAVIERILRHLGLWEQGVRVSPARAPPEIVERVIPPWPIGYGGQAEPWLDDSFPDYDTEPVMAYANG